MRVLIQHCLDESAASSPDAEAFRCDEVALTYAECATRSDQLARTLAELGVRHGDRVAIYLHKSLESALAIYGILKAGAAYVPLDPNLPPQSVAHVLQVAGIRHVVTEPSRVPTLAGIAGSAPLDAIVGVDPSPPGLSCATASWDDVRAAPATPPANRRRSLEGDLAYVMFTSGSTGAPKGIMHTHRSGLSYAQMAREVYDVGADDVLSNHSPLHFDMSTFDYFSGPLAGSTTVIIPEPYMLLPASLSELIQDERITIWYSVSGALVDLLLRGDLDHRNLDSLRWVNFGGEPLPANHLAGLMARLPNARFSNVYGPAEVNQCTFFHVPPLPNDFGSSQVPIGRVWDIADGLVVDADDKTVNPGETGELLIASSTRMQGYWQDPERTSASFREERFEGGAAVQRVYFRTGDIVRAGDDGELHFLGRKDRQVKVRGFRVELDGVEAVLSTHPAVAEAAAWLHKGLHGGETPIIVAAVRCREDWEGTLPEPDDLTRHAAAALPPYAVPSRLHVAAAFPHTGTGKIDRRALATLYADTLDAASGETSP